MLRRDLRRRDLPIALQVNDSKELYVEVSNQVNHHALTLGKFRPHLPNQFYPVQWDCVLVGSRREFYSVAYRNAPCIFALHIQWMPYIRP